MYVNQRNGAAAAMRQEERELFGQRVDYPTEDELREAERRNVARRARRAKRKAGR